MAARTPRCLSCAGACLAACCALVLAVAISVSGAAAQEKSISAQAPQSSVASPAFTEEDAVSVLDNLQAALQSYNRKKLLAQFDAAKMLNFSAFQTEIKGLFDRYDSFAVTYHLLESAVQNGQGVALADFGLDGTASSDEGTDLRRHTQLRVVVEWNGKQWKIVELSPRAVFE